MPGVEALVLRRTRVVTAVKGMVEEYMKTEIELSLRKFIAENLLFSDKEFPLPDDESLMANGLIDSTGIMELVGYVGSHFDLEVPVRDINPDNFDSIARLANYIRRRHQERAPEGLLHVSPVGASLPRAELS